MDQETQILNPAVSQLSGLTVVQGLESADDQQQTPPRAGLEKLLSLDGDQ